MKVKDLIKELQDLDGEALVALVDDEKHNVSTSYTGNIDINLIPVVEDYSWKNLYSDWKRIPYPQGIGGKEVYKSHEDSKKYVYLIRSAGLSLSIYKGSI